VMVMSEKNVCKRPSGMPFQPFKDRGSIAWIYHGTTFGRRILQQPDVVVGKGGKGVYLNHVR